MNAKISSFHQVQENDTSILTQLLDGLSDKYLTELREKIDEIKAKRKKTTLPLPQTDDYEEKKEAICEECDREMSRFEYGGISGWSCDSCGMSYDD